MVSPHYRAKKSFFNNGYTITTFSSMIILFVNIRLTHPKKLAAEHRVVMALGVIGEEAPATLDAGSDPVGQANAARTPLAASGSRQGPSVCVWIE
jgi:hypothetical protein